jgi:hypothetical protein
MSGWRAEPRHAVRRPGFRRQKKHRPGKMTPPQFPLAVPPPGGHSFRHRNHGALAQLVERFVRNEEVRSSNLLCSTPFFHTKPSDSKGCVNEEKKTESRLWSAESSQFPKYGLSSVSASAACSERSQCGRRGQISPYADCFTGKRAVVRLQGSSLIGKPLPIE